MRPLVFIALLAGCGGGSKHTPNDAGTSDLAFFGDLAPGDDLARSDAGSSVTRNDVYITWYGFNDNSCQVETDHDCNTIAFPKSDGWPVPHNLATEGTGTYADPITFASAAMDDGSGTEIPVGGIIYVPSVRKYFVMEDQCFECGNDWKTGQWHTDLWMGPSVGSDTNDLDACEDKLTIGNEGAGTGTIVIDPLPTLPVDGTPLFANNTCSAHQY